MHTFPGLLTTEAEVDDVLGKLVDRIVGEGAPKSGTGTETDALAVTVVDVLARHCIVRARDGIVRRMLEAKRNSQGAEPNPLTTHPSRRSIPASGGGP